MKIDLDQYVINADLTCKTKSSLLELYLNNLNNNMIKTKYNNIEILLYAIFCMNSYKININEVSFKTCRTDDLYILLQLLTFMYSISQLV